MMKERISVLEQMIRKMLASILCISLSLCTAPAAFAEDSGDVLKAVYSAPEMQEVGELSVTHPAPEPEETAFEPAEVRTVTSSLMERTEPEPVDMHPADTEILTEKPLFDEATYQPEGLVARQEQAASDWKENGEMIASSTAGAVMTFAQLRQKFPAGKYWNHAHNPGNAKAQNYADGWTDIPCPESHTDMIDTELQTCNAYWPGEYMIGLQCYGYADKLGFDATGTDPETWEKRNYSGALYDLKAGDIVRIDNGSGGQHSIFVIDVEGEKVIYTDCNEGGTCVIRWDQTTTKTDLANHFVYVKVCPTTAFVQDEYCHCSANNSGTYVTTSQLSIYSTHKLSGSTVGTIPKGESVSVSMGDASLCHVSYRGISGYADPRYLSRQAGAVIQADWNFLSLTMPDNATSTVRLYCSGNLPNRYRITADIIGGSRLDWVDWQTQTCGVFTVTDVQPVDGKIIFYLRDEYEQIVASCELPVKVNVARTTLTIDDSYQREVIGINADETNNTTLKLTAGGYLPDAYSFQILQCSYDICRFSWPGDWYGSSHDLNIEAGYQGDCTIVVGLLCQNVVRAAASIHLTVTGTVSVVPLLGRVNINLPDVPERVVTYLFQGILPRNFDFYVTNISTNALSTENSGDFYDRDGTLAIDMKVKGNYSGSGTITSKLWDAQYPDNKPVKTTIVLPVTVWQRRMNHEGLVLPEQITEISDSSFMNTGASSVIVPDGVVKIGSSAFAGNRSLSEIYLPASVTAIDANAFAESGRFTVFGLPGSLAEEYAINNQYDFVPVTSRPKA